MADKKSFNVDVRVKDSASGTLDGINKRMKAFNNEVSRARAPFDQLAKNYKRFTQVTGIDKIGAGLQSVARAGFSAFQSVARIVEPLAAITGAASLAGMYKLATSWANFGTALGQAAMRAGLTAGQLQGLENAGRLAGVSAEAVASGMTTLRDNMVRAQGGQAPQVIAMLQALGLSADDARRFAADTTKALPELADKIAALKDPTLQAQAATALFGGAGEQLLPFLRRGSAGIAEYIEKARRYGAMNEEGVAAANRLREAQTGLQLSVEGLGNSIAQQLEPVLGPVLTQMADWIARNREWIAQGIGDKVGEFVTWMRGVDWQKVGTDIGSIFTAVEHVATALGGWMPVGEALLGFFAVTWLAKMLLPIVLISKALRGLPGEAATAATKAGSELEKLGRGGGLASKAGGLLGAFGLWEAGSSAIDAAGSATAPREDGWANLAHNVAFEMNPLHWTRSYHPDGAGPGWFGRQMGGGPGRASNGYGGPAPNLPPVPKATQDQWNADLKQLTGYGWSKEQAAGILGNLDQESGGRHNIIGDGGAAFGLAQWHPDRQADFAEQFKHDIFHSTHAEQVAFVNWELNNTEKAAGDRLHLQNTVAGSAGVIRRGYERPANASGQEDAWRTARGERILRGYAEPAGPDRALPANAGTASSPGGAPAATVNGQIGVGITVNGPPNTRVTSTQTGPNLAPLRVERSPVGFVGQGRG